MSSKHEYVPPMSPPPNYANVQRPISQQDTGPSGSSSYQPYQPPHSPAPNHQNKISPYDGNQSNMMALPDPTYGGYYNQHPQAPPSQGYYAPNPNMGGGGYYGGPPPQQQGMYYPQGGPPPGPMYGYPPQGPAYGYYQQDRSGGSGGGICAGILGALACCCCLDMLF